MQRERPILLARLSESALIVVEVREEPEVDAQRIGQFTSGGTGTPHGRQSGRRVQVEFAL
jgi:hypothetical protein